MAIEADVDEEVEDVYDVSQGETEKTEDFTENLSSLLGEGGLGKKERRILVKSTQKMLSEGKINKQEASEVLDSAVDNLDHEFSGIQSDNAELLRTFTKTHPDLIEDKSEEIAENLPFSSNNKRLQENTINLAKEMKNKDAFEEEHFSNLVQDAANNLIGEEDDTVIESKARGRKGSARFLNELIDGNHVKKNHFAEGQIDDLREELESEKPSSIIGEVSNERGDTSEEYELFKKINKGKAKA